MPQQFPLPSALHTSELDFVQTTSSETAVISLVVIFRNSQSTDFTLMGLINIGNFHSMRAYPRVVNKPSSSYCVGGALGGKNTTVDSPRLRQPGRGTNTTR